MITVYFKKLCLFIIQNDRIWGILNRTVFKLLRWSDRQRQQYEAITSTFTDFTVRYGVFIGMK